jgi:hypothetical protein
MKIIDLKESSTDEHKTQKPRINLKPKKYTKPKKAT